MRAFFIILLQGLFKDKVADECQPSITNEIHVFLNVSTVCCVKQIILMPKMRFSIFVLSNMISSVIAVMFRSVLDGKFQAFIIAAVGLNLGSVTEKCRTSNWR